MAIGTGTGLALGAGASVLGSALGKSNSGSNAANQATGISQEVLDYIKNLYSPTSEELNYNLPRYSSVGTYTPDLEGDILMGGSEYSNITTPQETKDAQFEALRQYEDIANAEGFDPQAMAAYDELRNRTTGQIKNANDALVSEFARRGMAGSGLEAASRLAAQQASATASGNEGVQIAAQAQQRALDALKNQAQLGTDIRGQSFDEQSKIAEALDTIQKFNTQSRQDVQQRNVDRTNTGQLTNLQNLQDISNKNVGQAQTEEEQRVNALQNRFGNELDKARAMSGQANTVGQNLTTAGGIKDQQQSAFGNAITKAGTGVGKALVDLFGDEE